MSATITTAARRITNTVNATRRGDRLYFDSDGRLVFHIVGPEAFGPSASQYYIGELRGGYRITQVEAQTLLDERAASGSTAAYQVGA